MKLCCAVLVSAALGSNWTLAVGQETWRVSGSKGGPVDGDSDLPSISADGNFVAFESLASNLVARVGTTLVPIPYLGFSNVFVHDCTTGDTKQVSVDPRGRQANGDSYSASTSADGRLVAFFSYADNLAAGDTNGYRDVFVHDCLIGTNTRVSVNSAGGQGDSVSWTPSISSDGRSVAFASFAGNLVPGDTNGSVDVFVHDLQTGTTTCVSVDSSGDEGRYGSESPSISADGRMVAFESWSPDLVSNDTNNTWDVFVHDRQTGTTTRVSVDSSGVEAKDAAHNPSISGDGRFVAFDSYSNNLVPNDTHGHIDVFVHDLQTGTTTRVSDVFLHDRQTGTTTRLSVDSSGGQAHRDSESSSISADGRFTAFSSTARDLVLDDKNWLRDVFVHGPNY